MTTRLRSRIIIPCNDEIEQDASRRRRRPSDFGIGFADSFVHARYVRLMAARPRVLALLLQFAGETESGTPGRVVHGHPASARDDVARVPLRPVMLRSGCPVLAVASLRVAEQLDERPDIQAGATAGKPRGDL